MMDEKLLERLDELNDLNSQISGMIKTLDVLDEYHERQNNEDIREGIMALMGWLKNLQVELIHIMDELDEYILRN